MTPEQLTTLKNYIAGQADLNSEPMTDDGHFNVAAKLNLQAVPNAFTWKGKGTFDLGEILGDGYDYTRIDNLTVGKARIWDEVKTCISLGQFTANLANHRVAITGGVFTTAGDDAMRLSIFGHLQRFATRFERVFTGSDGTTTTNAGTGPVALVVEGPVTQFEVKTARTQV